MISLLRLRKQRRRGKKARKRSTKCSLKRIKIKCIQFRRGESIFSKSLKGHSKRRNSTSKKRCISCKRIRKSKILNFSKS
jgi:hypothetical protein